MELSVKGKHYIVGGVTGGFGKAICELLISEGATVTGIARNSQKIKSLLAKHPDSLEIIEGDITEPETINLVAEKAVSSGTYGLVVNAGGPPAASAMEATMDQWDDAYYLLLRWKVDLVRRILPLMVGKGAGRILFIESVSVKTPVENLVLSNSLRMSVVGYARTLAQEISGTGVTVNLLAPGYHKTDAVIRLVNKRSELNKVSFEQAQSEIEKGIPEGRMGEAGDFASLAMWILSPRSNYVNGQTFSVDGGLTV